MKNKRFRHIVVVTLTLFFVAVSAVYFTACKSCNCRCNSCNTHEQESPSDKATITFDTNGGSKVDPIIVEKGSKLSSLPQSYLPGSAFDYWYTDATLKNEFSIDTVINNDMTLYAGFTKTNVDVNLTETNSHYVENASENYAITIIVDKAYSKKEFIDALCIEAVTGFLPWNEPDELADELPKEIYDWYDVVQDGFKYTLKPKGLLFNGRTVYAYTPGQLYQVTIPSRMYFENLSRSVTEYSFRIADENKSADVNNVQYKDAKNLRFVKKTDILNLNEITDNEDKLTTDTNGFYTLYFSENLFNEYDFSSDNILCIGDGKALNVNSLFVKVVEVIEKPGDGKLEYLVLAVDADIEDVFSKIDVNYNNVISSDDILENLDLDAMKEEIKTNGSLEQVTDLMSKLLLVSDEVQEAYGFTSQDVQKLEGTNPGTGLPDFCYNTEIRNEATLLKFKMLEDAEVKITAGKGHNPNFDSAYTDEFVALRITFSYEATIKNKLEIQASITFTQYLAASAQGYLDYDMGFFKLKWAEFDFAVNLYSQTDIDFKILVRTVKQNGTDKGNDNNNGDDKKEGFKDIAEKIAEKLKSEEGDDPDNLVAELNEMLSAKDTEIELFRAPILNIPIDIIPGIPVMQVNVELDFLVTMRFAAGFNAHVSVLEAIQVGVTGSTKTKSIKSYKHDNLPGGNQYALQLSACGYLGFKAGFEGGISVSFCGLSSLGRVGIWVYAGAYIDIYGFAQATLVKQNSIVTQSLVGGYYIEIGVFVEVKLEARSKLFNTSVGIKLVDEKWPLVKFGNKEVLVSVENKALEETVYIANNGENEASIALDSLPKLNGTYIDITTGETYTKEVPWEKVTLKTSLSNFKYNPANKTIDYGNYSSLRPASEICIATYFFNGPILQFNMSATQYKDLCPFASTKIVYYDASKMELEDAGKEVSIKFYSLVEGKKELLEERKVLAGSYIYSSDNILLDGCKYMNITWDKIPWNEVVTEDTEFVCSADLRQTYIAFIYYDPITDAWITEVRPCNLGEMPVAPNIISNDKVTFTGWQGRNGINNNARNTPSDRIGEAISEKDLRERGYFVRTTCKKDVNKALASYSSSGYFIANYTDQLIDSTHTTDDGIAWYYAVSSIYIANYETSKCKITIHNYDVEGKEIIDESYVDFNTAPDAYKTYSPFSMEFLGFALEKDGEVVYKTAFEVGNITNDIVLYAKYKNITHKANLYYYDASIHDYKYLKTIDVLGGKKLGELTKELECITDIKTAEEDGVETKFLRFVEYKNNDIIYLRDTTMITRDIDIYPVWERKVDVTFDAGEGMFTYKDNDGNFVKKEKLFTESKLNYKLELNLFCVNNSTDPEYKYEFIGWKNTLTDEEILFNNTGSNTFVVECSVPTVFIAIYKKVERNDYAVNISTEHGTLKDGKSTSIVKNNLTFAEYQKIKAEYAEWFPESYHDDEEKCTYKPYQNVREENNTYTLTYKFTPTYDRCRIIINPNGGVNNGITMYDNVPVKGTIDLSTISITRVDDYGTWKMKNWTDLSGNTYKLDDIYVIKGNDTLTINWEIVTYIDYQISFILDDVLINTLVYHKDDTLTEFTKPLQADGKVFSGWTWYDANDVMLTEPLQKMPAQNLTLKGYTSSVYIIYKVDGNEIYKDEGRVGYEETVKEQYVKEGYTVSNWESADVTVSNSKFVMPEKDIVFNATSTVNSYTVTYYHNDTVYGDVLTVNYGEYVSLKELPQETGKFFAWSSSDVNLGDFGFTMPSRNVEIRTISSDKKYYVIYYLNNELYDYYTAIPNEEVFVRVAPLEFEYADMEFSGWYLGKESLNGKQTFVVGDNTTYVYGYTSKGSVKVNIYFDEAASTPDMVLYAKPNDVIDISMMLENEVISGYKINDVISNNIEVTSTDEINAYVVYDAKKYKVSYNTTEYSLPEPLYYRPLEKVYLASLPQSDEYTLVNGWFSAEVEILTDEVGESYFIMPNKDVIINLKHQSKYEGDTTYLSASTYIVLPNGTEQVLYQTYKIYNDDQITYFEYPMLEGYEFIGFKDESGEIVAHDYLGIRYSDMDGKNKAFYTEYRKLELHIATFKYNNKIIGYREFYDSYEVFIDAPEITLLEDEVFTGWMNLLVSPSEVDGKVLFYTGDRQKAEYAKMDLEFVGYSYYEEDSYSISIEYEEGNYEFFVNQFSEIILDRYHNNFEVKYDLYVNYSLNDATSTEKLVKNGAILQNGEYLVSIPSIYHLMESLKVNDTDIVTINYFTVKTSSVSYDYSDEI